MKSKEKPRLWTEKENEFLREHYPDERTVNIARVLRRTPIAVEKHAEKIGLRKSRRYWQEQGRLCAASEASKATRFKKGSVPANKGKKEWQYKSADAIRRSSVAYFKPGNIPKNAHPVGYECVKDGYVMIKVEGERRMIRKHIWVWEQHYGKRPEGHYITFRDRNRLNCDISNLICLSSSEFARFKMQFITDEQKKEYARRAQVTRNELIRKDKMRIRWGMEPRTKLVKRWYAPERKNVQAL